jgi:cysteine desulfurase / selenocysteine lyase
MAPVADPAARPTGAPPDPPAAEARSHFNHAGSSPSSAAVTERVIDHLRLESEIGGYEAAERVADEVAAGREALGSVLGGRGADVVAVESATRAWEMVVWSLAHSHGWGPRHRVVVDQFAYVSSWAVLWNLRAVLGIEIAVAPAGPDGAVDPTGLGQVVDDHVALVLITHVPTHVGTVTDVAGVAAALAELDASPVLAVDVSQSLGQLPVDVAAWGAQVAFAPGRKFLRAPRGTGVLYVASDLADSLTPLGIDLTATTAVGTGGFALAPGARRFDLFEHSPALRLGLGLAAEELRAAGPDLVSAEVARRTAAVASAVAEVPALALVAPEPLHGIVSFTHDHLDPTSVRAALGRAGINAWTNVANGSPIDGERRGLGPSVRLSPHHVTTDLDLERLAAALHQLG